MTLLDCVPRLRFKSITAIGLMAALAFPSSSFAYSCSGAVNYLGIDSSGSVYVAVGSTALHAICNTQAQGSFTIPTSVCKTMYASFLAARLAGKNMMVYYGDNGLTCTTIPSWSPVPSAYFVEGPY